MPPPSLPPRFNDTVGAGLLIQTRQTLAMSEEGKVPFLGTLTLLISTQKRMVVFERFLLE